MVTQVGFFLLWHVSQVQSSSYDVSLSCILLLVVCLSAAFFFLQHVTQVQSASCGISPKKPDVMIGVQSLKIMPLGQLRSYD